MPSVSPYAGTSDLVALGRALRGLREHRGLAQEAVGFDAGVGRNYVNMAELGQMNPAFVVLLGITRTLGSTLPELIGDYQRELDRIDPHAGHDVPLCPTPEALAYMERLRARDARQRAAKARRAAGRMRSWT
jgi:transcriptional regulator with XRE-family HTH domain